MDGGKNTPPKVFGELRSNRATFNATKPRRSPVRMAIRCPRPDRGAFSSNFWVFVDQNSNQN